LCAHENVLRLIEVYEVDTINLKGTDIVHIVVEPWAPDSIGTFLKMVRAERADRYFSWYRHESINEIISGICQQLGDGLEFLHSHEIKHGDINIENILLYTPPGDDIKVVPIISDLGSGTIDEIGDPTMANFSNGAPPYRSPELLQRLARALSADVFAMGVCFLYLYAAARDSHQAVAKIDTVIRESQTKMFGSEIPKILNLLNEDGFRPAEDSWLQKLLAWLTRYMLAGEPFERMEARQIRRMLRRHGPTLFNEMVTSWLDIVFGKILTDKLAECRKWATMQRANS
jgi:serine/threonine protein kinase